MAVPTLVSQSKNSSAYPASPVTVTIPATASGSALVIVVMGEKILDPYAPGSSAFTSATTAPTVKDNLAQTYSTFADKTVNFDGDLSYYNSVYVYYAANVSANITTITVTNADSNTGRPVYNGGMTVCVYNFSGIAAAGTLEGNKNGTSAANPAVLAAMTPATTGDLIMAVGVMRKASEFSVQSGYTLLDEGRLEGTANDYFGVAYKVQAFTTTALTNIAITSNVLTVTSANAYTVGQQVTFGSVVTNSFLNGQIVTVASSNGTTFTAPFTHANVGSGADTGNVITSPIQPGFVNPMQQNMGLVTLALKHS
jgi:hypothetical protein